MAYLQDFKDSIVTFDQDCSKCNAPMVLRLGRRGHFWGCSNFPTCKNTKNLDVLRVVKDHDTITTYLLSIVGVILAPEFRRGDDSFLDRAWELAKEAEEFLISNDMQGK